MKKVKLVSIIMAILLLLLALSACSGEAKWSDENVIFSYDEDGNPIITFPDNFEYPESYYDDVGIKGYGGGDPFSYDFYSDILFLNDKIYKTDSLYLVRIIKKLSPYEDSAIEEHYNRHRKMYGNGPTPLLYYYEVVLVYDFLRETEVNKTFIMFFFNVGYYRSDIVAYQSGDCFIAFIYDDSKINNCPIMTTPVFKPLFFEQTDSITMDNYLYTEDFNMDALDDWGGDKIEKSVMTIRNRDFRRTFYQKVKLSDFLEFIKMHMNEVGYTPSEKSALYDKNTENE